MQKTNSELSPVFIIGNPRSGTTLLRLTLNSHPDICIPPESHFFLWLEDKYGTWRIEDGLDEFIDDLFSSTKFETWDIGRNELIQFISEKDPENYAELNACVYLLYAYKQGKPNSIWGDKNKLWKEKLSKVQDYYPEARFIHLHRDGRDVACSYKELSKRTMTSRYAPKLPSEIKDIANKWKENIQFLLNFTASIDPIKIITISYEDLVMDQANIGKELCTFLGIEDPPHNLSHLKTGTNNFDEPEEFLQWKEKTKKPTDARNIGKFKSFLTPEEIDTFNEICKDELKVLGYIQ